MDIDTSKSKIDILRQLIAAYKQLNTISDDMRFQQLATIDSILADCMEDTISDDELAYRVNEAVGEYNTIVTNRGGIMTLTPIFTSHIDLVQGYTLERITDRSDHIEFKFSRKNDIPIHMQLYVAHKDEVYATSYMYYKYLRDSCVIDNIVYSPDNTDPAIISYLCIAIQRSAKYVTESIALSIGGAST